MNNQIAFDLVAECDNLAREGKRIEVSWNGGNDEGQFVVQINDNEIGEDNPIYEPLVELVEKAIGYGSFSGNFCAEGEVYYDPETKCLVGEDRYTVDETDARECKIEVRIPKTVWFDRIDFGISDSHFFKHFISVTVVVNHGPRTLVHDEWERDLESSVGGAFDDIMAQVSDWDEVLFNRSFEFSEFTEDGDDRLFIIREVEYTYGDCEHTDINISLTDSNDDDETNEFQSN